MAVFKCKMCGGTIEFNPGDTVGICDSCGTKQTLPKLDDERRANLYDRANHFRRNNEFDKAMGIYESILNEDTTDAEAYWSIVLCRYGIEYVEDPATHKRVPTVNRAQYTSIFADEDYKSAIANADSLQKTIYEEEAKAIDEIQKGILEISQKEAPFDVFICYKETGADGRRTVDSVRATELYHELVKEGFKVFFSRITLEDKLGTAYEPYIFAALHSAKVMVVLGTKAEHFNAVWVKNEWSRFLSLIKSGAKKTLIPAYQDMDPYDLPEEFSHLQAQDMSKLGFMQDLIRGIKKITAVDEPKAMVKETVVVNHTALSSTVAPLLKRAFMFLEDGKWAEADEYCEKVLDQDPECAEAYLGKLMAELHVKTEDGLKEVAEPFNDYDNAKKASRFDSGLAEMIKTVSSFIRDRNDTNYKKGVYGRASSIMRKAKTENDYTNAAALFDEIAGFLDADELSIVCVEKAQAIYLENEQNRKQKLYDAAASKMKSATTEEDFKNAGRLFTELDNFKNAVAKVQECLEKAEVARKDKIYADAMANKSDSSIDSNKTAIRLFESIIDWKDSRAKIDECNAKIKEIKIAEEQAEAERKRKEEEEAAERRRRAEEARIAAEKAKARNKKIAMIGGLIAAVLIVFLIVLNTVILPANNLKKAASQIDAGDYDGAILLLKKQIWYKDSDSKLEECYIGKYGEEKWNAFKALKVGDHYTFGSYEQDNDSSNGKEDIEWRVLAKEDNRILVISEYVLDCQMYNIEETSWETSSLREWLNDTFLKAAFTDEEQKLIPSVTVTADANPEYSTNPGNNTEDKVFLLSITEALKYFPSSEDKKCFPTKYAIERGIDISSDYIKDGKPTCWWWLRLPGCTSEYAVEVDDGGYIFPNGYYVYSRRGVRPALWIEY